MKIAPRMAVLLVLVAASGIAIAVLAAVVGTVTGDWVDATSAVGYPAIGFLLVALLGLGVLVFLGTAAIFLMVVAGGSNTAPSRTERVS